MHIISAKLSRLANFLGTGADKRPTNDVRKFSLTYAFLLMGFTAIVAQVVLIRELLTSFSGNELAIGIFFANWLLLEALGSYLAGRWADKVKSGLPYYVCLQLFLAFVLPAVIFLTRIVKYLLGIIPGQGVNVFTIFYASFFLLTPLGLADGAQFSFACRIFTEDKKQKEASSIGKVYIYESIGSLAGGIVGTYLCLQYLHPFQTVFGLALLNISSAICLLSYKIPFDPSTLRQVLKIAATFLLVVCVLLFPLGGVDWFHRRSMEAQWRDYEVLGSRNSIYGNVTVLQRFGQLNLMSNGVPIATIPTPDIAFIEEFVHLPLLFQAQPQQVLLIGGGIGGVLREILKHPVQQVDYAELDPLIVRSARQYAPLQRASDLNDSRVYVHYVDGRYFLRTTNKKYDLIFINLPDPSTLEINRFYTQEFYRMSKQRLKEHGILCFRLPGSTSYLSQELIDLNANLIQTIRQVFPHLRIIPGEYNIVLASSTDTLTSVTPHTLIQRTSERVLQTRLLSDFHLQYKLDDFRLTWYHNEMKKASVMSHNQDFSPSALYYDLVFWNSIHSPGFARIFSQLKHVRFDYVLIAIPLIFVFFFFFQRFFSTGKPLSIILPITATGFTGMGVDIVLVLVFQAFYGYIYHWIGLLIAAFMVGLTCGGMWMIRKLKYSIKDEAVFLALEISIVLYTVLLIAVLFLLNRFQEYGFIFSATQFILLLLSMLCGFLVGAEFPLANKMYLKNTSRYTHTAGILYATDLIGSWIGALFVTIVFIPLFGMIKACVLMVCINVCSAFVFYRTTRIEFRKD